MKVILSTKRFVCNDLYWLLDLVDNEIELSLPSYCKKEDYEIWNSLVITRTGPERVWCRLAVLAKDTGLWFNGDEKVNVVEFLQKLHEIKDDIIDIDESLIVWIPVEEYEYCHDVESAVIKKIQ